MGKSTKRRPSRKSPQYEKPYPEFPLTAHPTGRWCKKHRGKQHYFGPIEDWQGALERYKWEWPYILDGRTPLPTDSGSEPTIAEVCNAFLTGKSNRLESGELAEQTYADYYNTCVRIVDHFGKDRRADDLRPIDFEAFRHLLAQQYSIVTLKNEINRARSVFKFASDSGMIDRPVAYGQSFNRPSASLLRKARNAAGPLMFEADELRRILDALEGQPFTVEGQEEPATLQRDPVLKAMILLGINAGFGNNDVASLPTTAVDLKSGWMTFPRPKTGIQRRVPLWPETVESLTAAIALRPTPKSDLDTNLCFLTNQGNRWIRVAPSKKTEHKYVSRNTLADRFGALLKRLGINGRRRLGFYALRHTFETIAGESRDQVAVDAVMGHADQSMAATYRERISDERLQAVVAHVRSWLWPESGDAEKTAKGYKDGHAGRAPATEEVSYSEGWFEGAADRARERESTTAVKSLKKNS